MKTKNKISLLLAFMCVAAFAGPLHAQDTTKELAAFTQAFQDTYNKQDANALKEMYTKDAVRIMAGEEDLDGNDAIARNFADSFRDTKLSLEIKQEKVEKQNDGSLITTGTYRVIGKTNSGDAIDFSGAYTNTLVKENGQWKISKSVLAAM